MAANLKASALTATELPPTYLRAFHSLIALDSSSTFVIREACDHFRCYCCRYWAVAAAAATNVAAAAAAVAIFKVNKAYIYSIYSLCVGPSAAYQM